LFEEVDKPTGTKIVFEDKEKGVVETVKLVIIIYHNYDHV
jgi:hypothetical protein